MTLVKGPMHINLGHQWIKPLPIKKLKIVLRAFWWYIVRRSQDFLPRWIDIRVVDRMRAAVQPASTNIPIRRLFIDVSIVSRQDAGTGIQRIVRAISTQLLADPSPIWEIHFMASSRGHPYREVSWPITNMVAARIVPDKPGDVFLGLDFALDAVPRHQRQLLRWKENGVALWFVIYDLLPVQRPAWFSDQLVARFRRWLRAVAGMADGFLCISPPVDQDLRRTLFDRFGLSAHGNFRSAVFPMGWDLAATQPTVGIPPNFAELLEHLSGKRVALMVGTLEPRKGHEDILNAFETLWKWGSDSCLVIVGKPGWKTERLQRRLLNNVEMGVRLFWLSDASDEALGKFYDLCSGVIIASYGEGFGLPLIEAIGYGKPVLARDIPVFRLHEAKAVQFFSEIDPMALGEVIDRWLEQTESEEEPVFAIPVSWSESCAAVKLHLEGDKSGRFADHPYRGATRKSV